MSVFSRFPSGGRVFVSLLLLFALCTSSIGTAFAAGTTGTIVGTVKDAVGNPLPNVVVVAASPSGTYKGVTDAKGFYSFTGISPDTFTVSFSLTGYQVQSVTGVNIVQDNTTTLNARLDKSLSTLARTTTRSQAGAFQPNQTQDAYTVGPDQIQTIQGRDKNTNEANLLGALPGASFDSSGYPVLRGGRENEEGYQFEGISITDSYSNQFQNSLSVNGIQSFQLVPGSGNATVGNAGTGSVNYTAKRGSYPGFGSIEGEVQGGVYGHQLSVDFGIANPSGTISNYVSFIGQHDGNQIGPYGFPSNENGEYNGGLQDFEENNFIDNFIFKFGKDKSYEFQALYQNQIDRFGDNYGGLKGLNYDLGDPYFTGVGVTAPSLYQFLGFSIPEITHVLSPQPYESASQVGPLPQSAQYQPNELYKLQLSHNFGPSAFLKVAYYGVNAVTTFNLPDENVFGAYELQGSLRHGASVDFTDQLGSNNQLQVGGKYEYNHPIFNVLSQDDASEAIGLGAPSFGIGGAQGFEFADFSQNNADCQGALALLGAAGTCGYLSKYFPNGVKAPNYDRSSQIDRADFAAYVNDHINLGDRVKIEAGVRMDAADSKYPTTFDQQTFNIPNDASHPVIIEPRIAANFQLTRRDSIRMSAGRSTQFPPLGDVARTIDRSAFNEFNAVPSYNVLTNAPAMICGPKGVSQCANYGDQLFQEYQLLAGTPIQPVVPETFNSFDFSYEHQFPEGIGVKVTPFYTRGYNIVDRVSNVTGVNPETNLPIFGPALSTNLGIEKTTGVEFLLTREAQYGFSGQLSATYINKLSNVPPLSTSEDFFPTIPTASLALGNLYRVGYLSPFQATLSTQYKTRFGLRINPQITYNKGYPLNPGLLTAAFINGVPVNVPLTDITGPLTGTSPGQFVDPANPGTYKNPNVAAALGTPTSASAGGVLSNARLSTNLTIELSPPGTRSTFGVQIFNLFDELYGRPSLNSSLQPVSTGVLGPQTGQLLSYQNPYQGVVPYLAPTPLSEFGNQPYSILYGNSPTTFLFYYELKL